MASFEELYNIAVGNQQQQQVQQQQQAIQAGNFQDLYQQLVGANQQLAAAQAPTPQQPSAPQLQGWYQDNPEQAPTRQMNPFEQGLTGLSDWGEGLVGLTGFDANAGFTPENVGRFIAGLPFQMVGGFAGAPSKFYESISGQNILDRPGDDSTAYQYELTPEQRGAEFVDAILDTGGLGFGGSAKMLGTGAKLLTGGRAGERLTKGVFTAGLNPETTSAARMFAARTAEDVVEEAGEEFTQSFLDDTRWNTHDDESLQRAATGAAWGALGGGVMSAGAQGVNYLFDKTKDAATTNAAETVDPSLNALTFEIDKDNNKGLGSDTNLTQSVAQDRANKLSQDTYWPGSVSAVNMTSTDAVDPNSMEASTTLIKGAFEGRLDGSREAVANAFGTDVETMSNILYKMNEADRKQALNNLIQEKKARGEVVRVIIGRNPDTNSQGLAYINIDKIYSGVGIKANRHVITMFGADFDGDRTQVYFSDIPGVAHYVVRNYVQAGTGKGNIDAKYLAFARNEESGADDSPLIKKLEELSQTYAKVPGQKFDLSTIISNYKTRRAEDGVSISQAVAEALDQAYAYIAENQGVDPLAPYSVADDVIGRTVRDLEKDAVRYDKPFSDAAHEIATLYGFASDEVGTAAPGKLAEGLDAMFTRSGGLDGQYSTARMAAFLGKIIESRSTAQNPFFRETAAASMEAHQLRADEYIFTGLSADEKQSIFKFAYAYFFNQTNVGVEADAAAEQLFRIMVLDRFRLEMNGTIILTGQNLKAAQEAFARVYNEEVVHLNKAKEIFTVNGEKKPYYIIDKPTIKVGEDSFFTAFADIISETEFDKLFDTKGNDLFVGIPVGLLLEDASARGHDYQFILNAIDDDLGRFFARMADSYTSRENAQAKRIDQAITEMATAIRTTEAAEILEAGTDIDRYIPMLTHLVEAVQTIIGYEASFNLGIGSVNDFIKSSWGRNFLSQATNSELAHNSICSAILSDTFREVIALYHGGAEYRVELLQKLEQLAVTRNSMIIETIWLAESRNEGEGMALIKFLTDLDRATYTEKEAWFNDVVGSEVGGLSFLADVMKASSDGFALSEAGTRTKRAQFFTKQMAQESYQIEKAAIKSIENRFNEAGQFNKTSFMNAMMGLGRNVNILVSSDIFTSAIRSRIQALKEDRDKGTTTVTADIMYQAVSEFTSGGLVDFGRLLTLNMGVDSVENFQANRLQIGGIISGELNSIMLWDNQGRRHELTRNEFFEAILDRKLRDRNAGPKPDEFFEAFQKCPQLLSLLAPQRAYVSQGLSGASLKVGYDGDNLADLIMDYTQKLQEDSEIQVFNNRKNQLIQKLFDTPKFYEVFCYYLPDKVFLPETSYQEAARIIDKKLDVFANSVMLEIGKSKDSMYSSEAIEASMYNVWGVVKTVGEIANLDAILSQGDTLTSDAAEDVAQQTVSFVLADLLGIDKSRFVAPNVDASSILAQSEDAADAFLDLVQIAIKTMSVNSAKHISVPGEISAHLESLYSDYRALQDKITNGIQLSSDESERHSFFSKISGYVAFDQEGKFESLDFLGLLVNGPKNNLLQKNLATLGPIKGSGKTRPSYGISVSDFTYQNQDALIDVVDGLKKRFSYLEDDVSTDKIEEAIKRFEDGDNRPAKKLVILINSRLAEAATKRIMQNFSHIDNFNADFVAKEIECRAWVDDFIEDARDFRDSENSQPWSETGLISQFIYDHGLATEPFDFSARSAEKTYAATNANINMSGAKVASGIGINGALLKIYAAIGLLSPDFLNEYGNQSQSSANPDISMLSSTIDAFIDFIQEPMFLKLKKAMTGADSIGSTVDFQGINNWMKVIEFNEAKNPDVYQNLAELLAERRSRISNALLDAIRAEDKKNDTNMTEANSDLLAAFLTPYITVNYRNTVTGESGSVHINSSRFNPNAIADLANDPKFSFLADQNIKIESASIVPVSLEEMSSKILYDISMEQQKNPDNTLTLKMINGLADASALSWEHLNDVDEGFTKKVVNGISGRKRALPSMATLDFEENTKQKLLSIVGWNGLINKSRIARDAVLKNKTEMNPVLVNASVGVSQNLGLNYEGRTVALVSVSKSNGADSSLRGRKKGTSYDQVYRTLSNYDENDMGSSGWFESGGRYYRQAHLQIGTEGFEEAFKTAYAHDQLIVVPMSDISGSHVQYLVNTLGIPRETINAAMNHSQVLFGKQFCIMDPHYHENIQPTSVLGSVSQIELDPGSIRGYIVDPFRMGDAQVELNPEVDHGFTDTVMVKRIPISRLMKSIHQTRIVSDAEDINEALGEIRKMKNGESASIDISYWQELKTMGDDTIIDSVERYLENASKNNGAPVAITQAQNGDCVGICKTTVYGKPVYVPIMYTGSVPISNADVSLSMDGTGEVVMGIQYSGATFTRDIFDEVVAYMAKMKIADLSFKVVPNPAPNPRTDYPVVAGGVSGTKLFGKPHGIIDGGAYSGRVVEKTFDRFCLNCFMASKSMGGNFFFDVDEDGNWTLSDALSDSLKQKLTNEPDYLTGLLNGRENIWKDLVSPTSRVLEDSLANATFKNLVNKMMAKGGNPIFLFCPSRLRFDSKSQSWVDTGLKNSRNMEIMSFLKDWEYDVDRIMTIFHQINPELCASSVRESEVVMAFGQPPMWMFNHLGQVYSPNLDNTTDNTKKRFWFDYVMGVPEFFGENEAIGDVSRNATFSYQHLLQSLLRGGIYDKKLSDSIKYMQMNLGLPTLDVRETDDEIRLNAKNRKDAINTALIYDPKRASAERIIRDGLWSSRTAQYREKRNKTGRELYKRLDILQDDMKTSAMDDPKLVQEIMTSIKQWEIDLGIAPGTYSIKGITPLVRLLRGETFNGGVGEEQVTVGMFKAALEESRRSFSSNGLIVPAGRIPGSQQSIRIYQALLPQSLARSIWTASEKVRKGNDDNYDTWVEKMFEAQKISLENIMSLDNEAKRHALALLNDYVSSTWQSYSGKNNSFAPVSGFINSTTNLLDYYHAVKQFGENVLDGYIEGFSDKISENLEETTKYLEKINRVAGDSKFERVEITPDGARVVFRNTDKTVCDHILNTLVDTRRALGILNVDMLPANIGERYLNQGIMHAALRVGQDYGIGIYADTKGKSLVSDPKIIAEAVKNPGFRKRYAAWRTAEMYGVSAELLARMRTGGDLDAIIDSFMSERGLTERFTAQLMNIVSGKDIGIEGQMRNFVDLFATHAYQRAPYWGAVENGQTLLERALINNPGDWFTQVLVGPANDVSPDLQFALECINIAKKGDMAQKNLVSAIFSEWARRSSVFNFMSTAFVTPYFNYTTNRMGKILQWVAPVSTIHKLLLDAARGEGVLGNMKIPGTGLKLNEMALDDATVNLTLREAIATDMMHLGPIMVAMLLIGTAGGIEPPEDDDKWGNFEEWTILGMRIDVAWWLEDLLGLALPVAISGKAAQLGKPRLDILVNGMAHYLSNNPVTKVADACAVLFDPFDEFYRDYDDTLDSFAKAWGGAPSVADMMNGKMTSWGLSFVSQFITPLCLREIYNSSQEFEVSYKRIYEEGATGRPTEDALTEGKTQMATYQDAIIRKYTRNNPVMGFLADLVIRPQTGYMAHEMPRTIYYDPAQMNSLEVFSLYKDPFTKTQPKTDEEKEAMALQLFYDFQHYSVDELKQAGFVLDYETKEFMGGWLWDRIADSNAAWYEMEAQGYTNYNVMGYENVVEMRTAHNNYVNMIKSMYYDMLWNDEFSVAKYNRRHTQYAQDANGEWYATGYYPNWFMPVTFGPGETPGEYKYVMDREHDWATESVVTGMSTGERGLIPMKDEYGATPRIESYSSDGTNTGKSKNNNPNGTNTNGSASGNPTGTTSTTPGSSTSYPYGTSYRSGGGGGGGGSKGLSYHPQTINAPNPTTGRRTNRVKSDYDYLRPNFETKGSREAYKRSDI